MTLLFWKNLVAWVTLILALSSSVAFAEEDEPTFRRYNLRCLAPLLENLDAEAPKTLEEALLAGPAGSMELRLEDSGIGADAVSFPINSAVEGAQAHFNRGVALLHALWYREAERSFRTVVQLDPDAAMGYWGMAMANELRPGRARVFAKAAVDRTDVNRPELERRWVGILGNYYGISSSMDDPGLVDQARRSEARIRALEDLVVDYPEDVEAKAFMLRQLTLDQYRAGLAVTSRLGVEQLVKQLVELAPGHPSQQYGAFLWLGERPDRGVPFAKASVEHAPRIAEVWRYAAEALVGAGRSDEALSYYEAAIRLDQEYLSKHLLMTGEAENFGGNYEAMVRTLIGMGRIEEAIEWSAALMNFPKRSVSFPDHGERDLDELGQELWIEALVKVGHWERLQAAIESGLLGSAESGFTNRVQGQFWLGICGLFQDSGDTVEKAMLALKLLHRDALSAGVSNSVEQTILAASKSLRLCQGLLNEEAPEAEDLAMNDPWITDALRLKLYEKVGLRSDAMKLASAALARHPDHVVAVADFVSLSFGMGRKREAFFRFDRGFRVLAELADEDLPVLDRLAEVAVEMQLPDPWTLSAKKKQEGAVDLDSFGPRQWLAPMAPEVELADALGGPRTLEEFHGKPVILNFFLGVQCGYCLEQLNVFRPYLNSFRDAGIEFVAVSSDTVDVLQERIKLTEGQSYHRDGEFPFLILADPSLTAFRLFGGFDDFEDGPLHVTVLLDAGGRLVWADRGHAPFKRPEFLLAEAKRLMMNSKLGE